MNIKQARLAERHKSASQNYLTVVALGLLLPFLMVAVVPLLLMLFPVAVVAVPIIVPAMLGGRLASRRERHGQLRISATAARLSRVSSRGVA